MSPLTAGAVIATTATVMPTPLGSDNVAIAAELGQYSGICGPDCQRLCIPLSCHRIHPYAADHGTGPLLLAEARRQENAQDSQLKRWKFRTLEEIKGGVLI